MKNILFIASALFLFSCTNSNSTEKGVSKNDKTASEKTDTATAANANKAPANAATIMARPQVPVLCYHHIRPLKMPARASSGYEVSPESFRAQMKMLADSGYHSVLPEQLYNYLVYGSPLPAKPFMITYDDTDEEQFSIGKTEMDKYGFKGVYFIMTISIGRPRYMTKEQIKQLSDEGHTIASHTWDHHRVDRYKYEDEIEERGKKKIVNDWDQQLVKPTETLAAITGKTLKDFAYPFGIWNKEAIPEIKKRGFRLAFQLSTKRDSTEPLYTVRRMIVSPTWTPEGMLRVMRSTFGKEQ